VTRPAPQLAPPPRRVPTPVPRALVGPTASGKTEASLVLARRLGAEVVVVDSMTVYRGMDVGTAKPTGADRSEVKHHLVDLADPAEAFSVAAFQRLARIALLSIAGRGRTPLLVGGSGLYFRAVVDDLVFPGTERATRRELEAEAGALGPERLHARLLASDPEAAERIDPGNARRTVRALEVAAITGRRFSEFRRGWDRYPSDRVRAAGVEVEPEVLRRRIDARVRRMLEGGLIDEVRTLRGRGFGPFLTSSQAIGYLEVAKHLDGRLDAEEMERRIARRTRELARRQMAWFRRDPRVRWFKAGDAGAMEAVDEIEEYLRR
jgi:tRNA dimethylallyltransferase